MTYLRLLRTMWRCSPTSARGRRLVEFTAKAVLLPVARASRRWHSEIVNIGVTGSSGKTTTKNLIHAVLATRWPGVASQGSRNRGRMLLRAMLRHQSGLRYRILELGAFGPGTLDELLYAFRPDIAVITNIGMEHYATFRSLDAIAQEKCKLVERLTSQGLAVLNADDARVSALRTLAPSRTILAGEHPDADLRAEEVRSAWPDPLSFVARGRESGVEIVTQLYGAQWVFPVLAAIAVGRALGVPMEEIATALAACRSEPGRMSRLRTDNGADWICDDWKAPVWSYPSALAFLEHAHARRKILILGQFSDSPLKPRRLYARLARQGREVADQVCLVGRHARHGLRARTDDGDTSIQAFASPRQAAQFLSGFLRRGDLVLVKATAPRRIRLSTQIVGASRLPPPSTNAGQIGDTHAMRS
ncbi:MAG: UDP-N-acetylmuramoyl-tripeptide--D-alanyl-D-alanine ligase [Acidobacteriota bacterium]